MNAYRETDAHQRAKAAILEGCHLANYEAISEAIGDGWRADVMAARGGVRIAFEVQWSFLKLRETVTRQERYARDGVRGCWFFRQPPSMLEREDTLAARRDLPLFHLFANADGSFVVRLSGRLTPLETFVAALLGGRVRFCEEASAAETQPVIFAFYTLRCPNCERVAHVHRIDSTLVARCGGVLPLPRDSTLLPTVAYRAEFLASARALAAADLALHLVQFQFGEGDPQVSCPHCGAVIPARRLEMAGYGEQAVRRIEGVVTLRRPLTLHAAHWCFPSDGAHCCALESASSNR